MTKLAAEKRITSLEMHKALVHPLRISILEQLVHEACTATQLADKLEIQLTKLYYHLNLLEKNEIIEVVQTRLVFGILEKTYRATARNYVLDRQIIFQEMEESGVHEWMEENLQSLWDTTRTDIKGGVLANNIDLSDQQSDRRLLLVRFNSRMLPERAIEFYERLEALCAEFEAFHDDENHPESTAYTLTVACFPNK